MTAASNIAARWSFVTTLLGLEFTNCCAVHIYANMTNCLIGPEEDTPRPMECMEFVCRAPTELYKAKRDHPPFVIPRQPDLNDLAAAAEQILQNDKLSSE